MIYWLPLLTSDSQHAADVTFRTFHFVFVLLIQRNPIELVARLVNTFYDCFVDIRVIERRIGVVAADVAFDGIRR